MKNKQSRSWWLICLCLTAVVFMGMDCQRKQVITVIGGYGWMAKFMDQKGYVATDGLYGVNTQYNFENSVIDLDAAWAPYEAASKEPKPFDCGVCHTTGYTAEGQPAAEGYAGTETCKSCHNGLHPEILSSFAKTGHQNALSAVADEAPDMPFTVIPEAPEKFKFGTTGKYDFAALPGIDGQWVEPNVGCEACHGPSKAHANASSDLTKRPDLAAARQACAKCHVSGDIVNGVVTADGDIETDGNFVLQAQEWEEWQASPHSRPDNATDNVTYPDCVTCHNQHASTVYGDRAEANGDGRKIRTDDDCLTCHAGKTVEIAEMADAGVMCIDCHMPYAAKSANGYPIIGAEGNYAYVGDLRSHQFKIRPDAGKNAYIDSTTKKVYLDDKGKTRGLTVDLVCQPCHSANGLRVRDLPEPEALTFSVLKTQAKLVHTK